MTQAVDGLVLVRAGRDQVFELHQVPLQQVGEPFGRLGAEVLVEGGDHAGLGAQFGHVHSQEVADVGKLRLGIVLEECF